MPVMRETLYKKAMVEVVSKTTVFQHLDTYPIGGSSLYLFGRELKGESVAIKVNNIRPHFCVKLPDLPIGRGIL